MCWCFGEDGDGESCYAKRVQSNGGIVQIAQNMHTKSVDDAMRDEYCSVDSDCLPWSGLVGGFNGCSYADETGAAKGDAGRYCDLTKEVKPRIVRYAASELRGYKDTHQPVIQLAKGACFSGAKMAAQ